MEPLQDPSQNSIIPQEPPVQFQPSVPMASAGISAKVWIILATTVIIIGGGVASYFTWFHNEGSNSALPNQHKQASWCTVEGWGSHMALGIPNLMGVVQDGKYKDLCHIKYDLGAGGNVHLFFAMIPSPVTIFVIENPDGSIKETGSDLGSSGLGGGLDK